MADWEDWEAAADNKVEIKPAVATKFKDDDDVVDIDAKPEHKITSQPANADKVAKKNKAAAQAKKWEEKEKAYDDAMNPKKGPLTAEERKKAEQLSKESDLKNTLDLFGDVLDKGEDLKTEQAFVDYAKKVADILVKEDRKKYIQEFMKELLNAVYPKLTSQEYEQIHSKCTLLFNQKQKDEKGPGPKKKAAPKANLQKANAAKLMDLDDGASDEEELPSGGGRAHYEDFM